jgi:hypothetical protein
VWDRCLRVLKIIRLQFSNLTFKTNFFCVLKVAALDVSSYILIIYMQFGDELAVSAFFVLGTLSWSFPVTLVSVEARE